MTGTIILDTDREPPFYVSSREGILQLLGSLDANNGTGVDTDPLERTVWDFLTTCRYVGIVYHISQGAR